MTKKISELQLVFNKAWRGLKKQRWAQSMTPDIGCAYRGKNGRRCGIGYAIPDSRYHPDLEGHTVFTTPVFKAVFDRKPTRSTDHCLQAYLGVLQGCHDKAPRGIKGRMIEFARAHNLTIPR